MIKFNSLFILSLFILFLLVVNPASAQVPNVYISEIEEAELLGKRKIYLGEKIEFRVKICVMSDSPSPLNGFHIVITLRKPNGKYLFGEGTVNDYIPIGKCKKYNFRLNYAPDQVGTWKYWISLYTKDKKHKLCEVSGTFEVVEKPKLPKVKIEVLDIVGWTTALSMMITGLALALSRIIK